MPLSQELLTGKTLITNVSNINDNTVSTKTVVQKNLRIISQGYITMSINY